MRRRAEALCAASLLCALCVSRWGALLGARLRALGARADALGAHAERLHDAARALDLAAGAARTMQLAAGAREAVAEAGWAPAAALVAGEAGALRAAAASLVARHAGAALRGEWEAAAALAPCPGELRLQRRARALVERLRDSWQHLVRDRATRSLTYNDEQFHVLERITVAETGRRLRALLLRAAPLARARADCLADWCVGFHFSLLFIGRPTRYWCKGANAQ